MFFTNITPNGDSFFWSFGDGENSTDENPVHVFPFDGNFDVTLEVTNECGTESITRTITIVTIPVADFTSTNPEGCDSLTVMYTNTSSPNITSVAWEFPGGTPSASTQGNPTVTYRTPGVYDVRLTVSNSRYSVTIERENYVTLGSGPTADFGFLVSDLDVDFSNISINANSYEWDFGDGSGSSMENPSHTYSAGGTYTVQLVAENECGFDTLEQTIVLSSEPVADFSADQTSGCTPLTVNFTSLASNNTTSWNWSFPGGSPASSTAENPSVTYNNAGIYDVSLIVSNGQGSDTLTRSSYISVNSEPSPGFTFFNLGTTIDFINTSSNATSYFWDFGDGSTSTEISPNHEYAGDGNYTVSLTATNECGAGTLVINVPVRTFSASPTEGCDSLTTTFTGPTDGISSYNWSFPGGIPATSTAQNPTVTYSSAGTYDVVLRTTGSAGFLTITETNFITVFDDVPDASFTVSISGSTVTLTNTSTDATEYVWDFDDGTTSTEVNPTHTYAADGDYSILLTATNACGTSSIKTLVTISTLPVADFSADVTNGCTPLTVNFSDASSSTVTSWNWSFPGGTPSSSTAQNPTVTYAAAGIYDVSLIVTNNSGQDTVVRNGYITVDPLPQAGFTFNINGNTVDFTSTSTNATSYSWDFGDGNSSTEENPTHTYSTGGTYVAVLTVTNNCGSSTAEENVVTETPPRGDFTADVTNGCAPLTVNFSDASSPNTTSWSWTFDGGNPSTSSDQNPKVSYTSPGTYDVELIVSNVAGQDVVVKSGYITVEEGPDASFYYNTFGNAVAFVNTSLDADDFFWDFGDGNISTEENPTHFYAFAGTYEVFMTATNECGSTDFSDFVTVSQGGTLVGNQTGNNPTGSSASKTNEKEWLNDFRIYPNPNDGEFQLHLRTSSTFEDVEVKLYNVVGQQVFTQKESVGSGTLNRGYQLNHLPQGTYIFQIVSGDYRAYRKVVIK